MKEPIEWSICPVCNKPYGFINCRLTYKHKDGTQTNICLTCKVEQNRLKRLSTIPTRKNEEGMK